MLLRLLLLPLVVLGGTSILRSNDPAPALPPPAARKVDYLADIQPLLAKHCLACHGPETRKAGLRLDLRSTALKGGTSGPAVIPGKSAESPLVRYVAGLEPGLEMPPKGERLTPAQIGLLRAWIDQGAAFPAAGAEGAWWSLVPPVRPTLPPVADSDRTWIRTPVDAFILAKLRDRNLNPAPEADRRTLFRRLSFDLVGLPPDPAEVDAFVADPAPNAFERLVDRLLASPAYGERWARHWLDVVHYGDTHGYDKDKPRPNAWPYRDYVIRSLNADKPWDRFVQEQIAGDVLFPGEPEGIEALGFVAAGPWDFIGHAEVPESKIDGKIARHLDRDDMIANTVGSFLSLTVHCAQCHNHKFDPISQEDYYSLQAVFAAVDRTDRRYWPSAELSKRSDEIEARRKVVQSRLGVLQNKIDALKSRELADLDRRIAVANAMPSLGRRPEYGWHSAVSTDQSATKWVQVDLAPVAAGIPGATGGTPPVRKEKEVPADGSTAPGATGGTPPVRKEKDGPPGAAVAPVVRSVDISAVALVGCHDDYNNIGAGFGFPPRYKIEISDDADFATATTIVDRTAADAPNPGTALQKFALSDAKSARYVRVTATKLAPRQNDFIFALAELQVLDPAGKNLAAGKTVGSSDSIEAPPRWRRTNLTDGIYVGAVAGDAPADPAKLKADRLVLIERALGADFARENAALLREQVELEAARAALGPVSIVYAAGVHYGTGTFRGTGPDNGRPRPIAILNRGDVKSPGKAVGPGALSGVAPAARFQLPPGSPEGERRAALARWMTRPENPLLHRSIVNRVWRWHLGRGIVESPNDFGRMGLPPSHPELLDWLAVEFRAAGGSLKHLHRLIVNSSTYRQSSMGADPKSAELDANNTLFGRANRRRLEAEAVRDAVLAVSGALDLRPFGPAFHDFVIEKPDHSPHYQYHLADPEDARTHRRSIYRFLVRSQQQPFMATLDCADPSLQVDKRNETVSALQALALLNNGFMLTMSRRFADDLAAPGDASGKRPPQGAPPANANPDPRGAPPANANPDPRPLIERARLRTLMDRAFRRALARPPADDELDALTAYAAAHGLPSACRVLLNLNEFVFVD